MIWPDSFVNKVVNGEALETMKEIPTGKVDMCMTSPPYWGLRDYGVEQIFGGDPGCKHNFSISHRRHNDKSGGHGNKEYLGAAKAQDGARFGPPTKTCSKCKAWKGQLGLELTPEVYIEHLTEIFDEVKRVLKRSGTLWLNIGDTYSGSGGAGGDYNEGGLREGQPRSRQGNTKLQSKCLCMIPERLAWSLIQDGWILRNKIIWHKKNHMPSSAKDRFTNSWEYIFLFSKSNNPVYWINSKRLKLTTKQPAGIQGIEGEDWEWGKCPKCKACGEIIYKEKPKKCSRCKGLGKIKINFWAGHDYHFDLDAVREPYTEPLNRWGGGTVRVPKKTKWKSDDEKAKWAMSMGERKSRPNPLGKNPEDVWNINTESFPEAHFAVFPEKLCEKPIKAGCPEEVCKKCGKARERIVKKFDTGQVQKMPDNWDTDPGHHNAFHRKGREKGETGVPVITRKTIGWTSCDCNAGFEGGIVIDPFAGAGTVLFVAKQLRRRFLGIDIKEEYCKMSRKRLAQGVLNG